MMNKLNNHATIASPPARTPLPVPEWQNPQILGINKQRSHVPLRSFPSSEQAHACFQVNSPSTECSPNVLHLDSDAWRFELYASPAQVPPNFCNTTFDDRWWKTVRGYSAQMCECTHVK
jgi:hypothetical protein